MKAIFILSFFLPLASGHESDNDKTYTPISPDWVIDTTDGFAPDTLNNRSVILNYTHAVENVFQALVKSRYHKDKQIFSFANGKTTFPNWIQPEKKQSDAVYTKIGPNMALIALPREILFQYSEQYLLMFTSPSKGFAYRLNIGSNRGNHVSMITANITFSMENKTSSAPAPGQTAQ